MSLRPEKVEEESGAKDRSDGHADEDVVAHDAHEIVIVHHGEVILPSDELLLIHVFGEGGSPDRLGADTEDHGDLIDDHLGATKVVFGVEHVGGFEFAPLHLSEVEPPDDCHLLGLNLYSRRYQVL